MRSVLYLTVSALAAVVAAQENPFNIPNGGYDFKAGSATTLNWKPTTSGTVTLKLQAGKDITPDSGDVIVGEYHPSGSCLQPHADLSCIAHLPNSGSYQWTPPADLADRSDYSIEIIDDSDPNNYNFLPTFSVSGATGTATALTASETGTKTAATTASTATGTTATTLSTVTSTSTSSETSKASASTSSSSSTASASSSSSKTTAAETTAAATTTAAPSSTNVPDLNGGMSLKVPAGMMAIIMGAMMAM